MRGFMANERNQKNQNTNRGLYLDLSYAGILIFLLFRIPLTNVIGNEGNGYFSITWELYTLFGLFFGHCIYHITKDMIRIRIRKKQYRNSTRVLSTSFVLSFLLSVFGMAFIYFSSDTLLSMIHMKLSGIGFRFISILLIFTSFSGVLRGYFEGTGTKIPTCFSKIVEALIAGTGALIFTSILYKYGSKVGALLFNAQYEPAFGATGIIIGCICGSIFSLLFLIVVNSIYQKPLKKLLQTEENKYVEPIGSIFKDFFKISVITFTELLFFNLFRISNLVLYIKNYVNTDLKGKIVQYMGSYHGKVLVITGIFSCIILIFTGKYLKRIQRAYFKNNLKLSWNYLCNDIKEIIIFSISAIAFIAILAQNILTVLYKTTGNTEVMMLQIGSINILLIPLVIYLYRLISCLDYKLITILVPVIAYALQTLVMNTIVKQETIGALSLIISDVVFWFVVAILELLFVIKTFKLPILKSNNV